MCGTVHGVVRSSIFLRFIHRKPGKTSLIEFAHPFQAQFVASAFVKRLLPLQGFAGISSALQLRVSQDAAYHSGCAELQKKRPV